MELATKSLSLRVTPTMKARIKNLAAGLNTTESNLGTALIAAALKTNLLTKELDRDLINRRTGRKPKKGRTSP